MKRMHYSNKAIGLNRSTFLPNPPTLIEYKEMRFLILDAPSESNLPLYVKEMEKYNVTNLVRVCDPTYRKEILEDLNIKVHDWIFPDGEAPPANIVQNWLSLVYTVFHHPRAKTPGINVEEHHENHRPTIAVHCIAGLGRAPVLVALALIEIGMEPLESVEFIRNKRRGAINQNQLKFLETYYRRKKATSSKCCIM